MRKIMLIVLGSLLLNTAYSQNIFGKIKNKVGNEIEGDATKKVSSSVDNSVSSATSSSGFTDPTKYGKVIYTLSNKEKNDAGAGGFNIIIQKSKVSQNQLEFTMTYNENVWEYSNGQLRKTNAHPNYQIPAMRDIGSEKDLQSVDFSQKDMTANMMKTGKSVGSGMQTGKAGQTYTFQGKTFANYFMAMALVHNHDSTVIAVSGMDMNKKYSLTTSGAKVLTLPTLSSLVFISPDGNTSAAYIQGNPSKIYLTNGNIITINHPGDEINQGLWLHNTGNIYSIDNGNKKILKLNDKPIKTFDFPLAPEDLFISQNGKNMAWTEIYGYGNLYFSDGTSFENTYGVRRIFVNEKEVIVFLVIKGNEMLLCQHDL